MPNRIIKESAFTSDKIAALSDFEFRLWVGLITQADDAGRGDARPAIIKGRVFALRERVAVKDIDSALHALAAAGCVSLYAVDGKPYYQFPGWAAHQRVRDAKPKYPGPEDGEILPTRRNSPQLAADRGLNPIQSNPNPIQSEYENNARTREDDDGFDSFWAAYPKKSGDIRQAYMEYRGALQSVDAETLLAAAKNLAAADEDEVHFASSAEKWLRNKGWLQKPKKTGKIGATVSREPTEDDGTDLGSLAEKYWGKRDE